MTVLQTKQAICLPSLKLLSDYWTLRIIDELSDGELRFCELERRLEGSNTATLTRRLKDMQSRGLLKREEASRAEVTYSLTKLGREALPLLDAVNQFAAAAKKAV
jgi:DNA-binding HxlR family transcriptional regulator